MNTTANERADVTGRKFLELLEKTRADPEASRGLSSSGMPSLINSLEKQAQTDPDSPLGITKIFLKKGELSERSVADYDANHTGTKKGYLARFKKVFPELRIESRHDDETTTWSIVSLSSAADNSNEELAPTWCLQLAVDFRAYSDPTQLYNFLISSVQDICVSIPNRKPDSQSLTYAILETGPESTFAHVAIIIPDGRTHDAIDGVVQICLDLRQRIRSHAISSARDADKSATIAIDITQETGLHIIDNSVHNWSKRSKHVSDLAKREFDLWDGGLSCRGSAMILGTGRIRKMSTEIYNWENIGSLQNQDRAEDDVLRLWSRMPHTIPEKLEEFAEELLAFERVFVEATMPSDVPRESTELVALAAVKRSKQLFHAGQTIHLQCHPLRKSDLLRPVIAFLREWMGINRRSNESLRARAETWLLDNLVTPLPETIERVIDVVLNSGEENFRGIVDDLAQLIQTRGLHEELIIIVENLQDADELTVTLLDKLRSKYVEGCKVKILAITSGSPVLGGKDRIEFEDLSEFNFELPENEELSSCLADPDCKRLVDIAHVLGWDFLQSWLERIWTRITNRGTDEFEELLTRLLESGIVGYVGSVANVDQSANCSLLDLKFQTSAQLQQQPDQELSELVGKHFLEMLSEFASGGGYSVIRCKVRASRIMYEYLGPGLLRESEKLQSHDRILLARLWSFIASRAYYAGAIVEATRRLEQAHKLFPLERLARESDTIELFYGLLQKSLEVQGKGQFIKNGDEVIRAAERIAKEPSLDAPLAQYGDVLFEMWFGTVRSLWKLNQRKNLAGALDFAMDLQTETESNSRASKALRLEVYHVLSISTFFNGRLLDCWESSNKGFDLCIDIGVGISKIPEESNCHGSHDGAACCKCFRALAGLILGKRRPSTSTNGVDQFDASSAMKKAIQYSKRKLNRVYVTTHLVAKCHASLFHLLNLDFSKTKLHLNGIEKQNVSSHWYLFGRLIYRCSVIGEQWSQETKDLDCVREQVKNLAKLRSKWNSVELDAVWATYEALAHVMLDDEPNAFRAFSEAFYIAERGTLGDQRYPEFPLPASVEIEHQEGVLSFFLPEVHRYYGIWLEMRGDHALAQSEFQRGLEVAQSISAGLFEDRLLKRLPA